MYDLKKPLLPQMVKTLGETKRFKIQILLGITNPQWIDSQYFSQYVDGNWVIPTYATRDAAWAKIRASDDGALIKSCLAVEPPLLRVVEVA